MADTVLIFGDSGLFKSTNAGFAARLVYEKTRAPVRLVSADGSGWKPLQDLVDAGVIEPFGVVSAPAPFTLLRKLSIGWWPTDLQNGIWMPKTKLVPPASWDKVGGYIIDTINSYCDLMMDWLREKQQQVGQDVVGKFSDEDAKRLGMGGGLEEKFSANPQSHYNLVQREMTMAIRRFGGLPVNRVIFVAHESRGEEEDTRAPIRGPALVGKAMTDKIAKEAGDCLHFESVSKEVTEAGTNIKTLRTSARVFFMSHPDPIIPRVFYKCKPRCASSQIGALMKRWPGGYFEPTTESGLDDFLRYEDELIQSATNTQRAWKEEIDKK